jgi:hypothetical protein
MMHDYAQMNVLASVPGEGIGLLIGNVFLDVETNLPFVIVQKIYPLPVCRSSDKYVRIEPQDIVQTCDVIHKRDLGYVILGWYHVCLKEGRRFSTESLTRAASLFKASWQIYIRLNPESAQTAVFAPHTEKRLSNPVVYTGTSPVVDLFTGYNKAEILLERDLIDEATHQYLYVQRLFEDNATSAYREDIQFWIEKNGYRDVKDKLSECMKRAQMHQDDRSSESVSVDMSREIAVIERHLQDVIHNQNTILQRVARIENEVRTRKNKSFHVIDMLIAIFTFSIVLLLGVDIYIQQSRTQAIIMQNELVETVISQNDAMATSLALPATPTVIPTSIVPDSDAEDAVPAPPEP